MFKNLNLGALGFGLPFKETLEAAKIGGFQGVDMDIVEIEKTLESKPIDEVKHSVEENRLKLGGWGLPVNFRGDEETYQTDLEKLRKYALIAEELGYQRVFTWVLPFSDELSFDQNFEFHIQRLRPIAKALEDHGCYLGLEFIGPKTSRIGHKHQFIHTVDGMLELCRAIGTKNLGLLLDSWHWYTSYGTLDQLRELKGEQVIYVHINDAPAGVQVDEQIDNVRCLPGETGVIDLVGFLQALEEIGYEGPVTPEPFSKKLKEMPVIDAVKLTSQLLDKIWKEAGFS